jgi:hypothetical protein
VGWLGATYGVHSVQDATAVIYPRRHGKTLTQTLVTAITLASQPHGNVIDYNPTNDQAKAWLKQAILFLGLLEKDEEFGFTTEQLLESKSVRIRAHFSGTANTINVYGNGTNERNAQNLRGSGANVLLVNMDEGLFFVDAAYKVILPVVANGAALVITSSMPPSETGAFNLTKALYETGRPVMRVLDWRRACQICLAKEARIGKEVLPSSLIHLTSPPTAARCTAGTWCSGRSRSARTPT